MTTWMRSAYAEYERRKWWAFWRPKYTLKRESSWFWDRALATAETPTLPSETQHDS